MRRLLTLALLSAVLAAGCTAPAAEPPGSEAVAPLPPFVFGDAVGLHSVGWGNEPSIAVHPDGKTLFVAAPAGSVENPNYVEAQVWLWRSRDGGATWETLREPDQDAVLTPHCSCDTDVVVSGTGRVYLSDFYILPDGSRGFMVQRSDDLGETWARGNPLIAGHTIVDRQWLLAGDGDTVFLSYTGFRDTLQTPLSRPQGTWVARSDDGGETWAAPTLAVPGNPTALHGHPRMLPDGTLLVPYHTQSNEPDMEVGVARSEDGGVTWEQVVAAPAFTIPGFWPTQLAVNSRGEAALVWMEQNKTDSVLLAAVSTDGGRTWRDREPITNVTGHHALPWVTALPDGRFAAVAYASVSSGPRHELPEGTRWDVLVSVFDGADPAKGTLLTATKAPVKLGALCTYGSLCEGNRDRELADFLSVEATPDGALHVAFTVSPAEGEAFVHVARGAPQGSPAMGASPS